MMLRSIDDITHRVWHCASSPNGLTRAYYKGRQITYDAAEIDYWHASRGFRRSESGVALGSSDFRFIGYHYVIELDGRISPGRHLLEVGAHCDEAGMNFLGVGICMVGSDAYTVEQWNAASALREELDKVCGYPLKDIGHRDVDDSRKGGCPGFDVDEWLQALYVPKVQHICRLKA